MVMKMVGLVFLLPTLAAAMSLSPPPSSIATTPEVFNSLVLPTYGRYDIGNVISASGSYLKTDRKSYLDFVSGIATNSFGHGNPVLQSAVTSQLQTFAHVSNLYYAENQARLASWLLTNTFPGANGGVNAAKSGGKAFFCNSGAEANEGAIKLLRKWGHDRLGLTHPYIITMSDSFHGRTTGALGATNSGGGKYQKGFEFGGVVSDGFRKVTFNDEESLEKVVKSLNRFRLRDFLRGKKRGVAGIITETLQGEGGVLPGSDSFLKRCREITKEVGGLLVFDEVQTGMGRTGKLWNFQ